MGVIGPHAALARRVGDGVLVKRIISLLATAFLLPACDVAKDSVNEVNGMSGEQSITIHINEPISELLGRAPLTFRADCLQPVMICRYQFRKPFSSRSLPSVSVMDGSEQLLDLEETAGITIVIDEELGSEIRDIRFSLRGLPDNTPHKANKDNIYKRIQDLIKQGWTHMYHFPAPRIPGDQADRLTDARGHSLAHPWFDPRYEVSLDNWIKFRRTYHWYLHKNGYYLHLSVRRENSETEPLESGTYLTSLELMTEESYWRKHFEYEQKAQWKELLPELLEEYRQQRAATEEAAIAAGIRIEDDYRDPYIRELAKRNDN